MQYVGENIYMGTAVAQWLRWCATIRKVAGSIPAGVSGFFIDVKSFWSHYGPGVDSASNRNEYQEYFLGVKSAGAYGWQPYHHLVPLSRNLGTLISWKPLGLYRPVMGLLYPYIYPEYLIRYSDYATVWTTERWWFDSRKEQEYFSSPRHPVLLCD